MIVSSFDCNESEKPLYNRGVEKETERPNENRREKKSDCWDVILKRKNRKGNANYTRAQPTSMSGALIPIQ